MLGPDAGVPRSHLPSRPSPWRPAYRSLPHGRLVIPTSWRSCPGFRSIAARWWLTARSCRARRWPYRRMAGSTCTSRCCRRGVARHRSSAPFSPATTSPEPRHSRSRPLWIPDRFTASSPSRSGPPTPRETCSPAWPSQGAGLLVATMDGIADGTLVPRPQSGDGVSLAAKITVDDARVDWSAPGRYVDRQVRACTPAPGAWTTFRGERLKLGPVSASTVRCGRPPAIARGRPVPCRSCRTGSRSTPRPVRSGSAGCSRPGVDRCRRRRGRGARGCSRENVLAWSDPPRRVAYDLLRAVEADGAYANLLLPKLLTAGSSDRPRRSVRDGAGLWHVARRGNS